MSYLDDLKMSKKLLILVVIGLAAIIAVGYLGISGSGSINAQLNTMYEQKYIHTIQSEDAYVELLTYAEGMSNYLLESDKTKMDTIKKDTIEPSITAFNKKISEYESIQMSDEGKVLIEKIKTNYPQYIDTTTKVMALSYEGKNAEAMEIRAKEAIPKRAQIQEDLKKLVDINNQTAYQFYKDSDTVYSNIILVTVIITIIGAIILMFFGFYISRGITGPLNKTVVMLSELSKGHLQTRLSMKRKDEIGQMGIMMDTYADHMQKQVVATLHKISMGEKNITLLTAADDQDEVSPALNQTITTINDIVGDVNFLITESQEGRLKRRGDSSKYVGVYQDIIIGINNMLDAIVTPINEALRVADLFAHAKFTTRFDENVIIKGDLIALKEGLNTVGKELSIAINDVSEQISSLSASSEEAASSVEEITAGSASVAQSSAVVSNNAENSVSSVEQVLTAMEELTTSVSTVAAKVDAVSRLTQEANGTTNKGVEQAAVAETGINAINTSVNDVGIIITEIRDQMNEIGKIVEIISNIADQTNLLALNAAIEAARAGDAGMGFAVVANEVKTLAQDSQGSAENIAKIIFSLQIQSEKAASAMNQATNEVSKGSVAITDTIRFFNTIAEQVSQIAQNMTEVASLSEEEAAAVEEITASVSEVRSMANDTAKEAGNSAAASEEASAALNQMSEIISNLATIANRINESMSRLNG